MTTPVMEQLKKHVELTKPRLSFLVVLTALAGAAVAPKHLNFAEWFALVVGTSGIGGAANALNCYLERDVDALMDRTRTRPLVTGEVSPKSALLFSLVTAFASVLILGIGNNPLTAFLGLLGFVLYVAVYTPLKRISMSALFTGAVPGAIPPMMGWAAGSTRLEVGAWILFGILFFWQLPHFIAISMFRDSDYGRAGLKTLPNTLGFEAAGRHLGAYTGLLVVVTMLPAFMNLAGVYYLWTAIVSGLIFVALCAAGWLGLVSELKWSKVVFFGTLFYLPIILGAWVIDCIQGSSFS